MKTDLQKANRKVRQIVAKAARERDRYGYRENLGYDQRPALTSFLGTLSLSYAERHRIMEAFDNGCDNL